MSKTLILIIEDDADIVELLQYNLEKDGYAVRTALDGETGLEAARRYQPQLVLLDLMMPGMDGLEVCKQLKAQADTEAIRVIMITAKTEEIDVILGLELGADDYMAKPFSPREVLARVKAVLRRGETQSGGAAVQLEIGTVSLDRERHEVSVAGEVVEFTRAEFRLLWALASHPGRVFQRDELVEYLTAGETFISERNIDVHVSAVRKKLGAEGDLVCTVRGVGYKIKG
ncbi:MAG: DNA-binding response OmpR family regulator [Planctomycetota bacterium]|jgi:DNA-binding response OmpR family regulator